MLLEMSGEHMSGLSGVKKQTGKQRPVVQVFGRSWTSAKDAVLVEPRLCKVLSISSHLNALCLY